MATGCASNRDDRRGVPTLSLGLSSVRHIVNRLEAQYASVVTTGEFDDQLVKYDSSCLEKEDFNEDLPFNLKRLVFHRFVDNLSVVVTKCIPKVSFANFGALAVATGIVAPKMISYLVLYPFCRLVFGTLYPAYASYKAVRTKNLKEYVKWMMYWIVFALFTCTETITDVFLSWFPFYYEVKIVLVLWLLSPATKGSSILYRKFVHPALCRREQEIDEYIAKAKDQGYHTVLNLGTKGVNYATTVIMQTAIKGGGGLVQQLRKSYSLSDLSECEPREERGQDEADDVLAEPRLIRRAIKSGYATRRSASESNRSTMYFPEVDVDVRNTRTGRLDEPDFSHIKSTEDISSGYSSAENSASLTRTGSVGASARSRIRTSRTTITAIKRPQAAEDNDCVDEELHDTDSYDYSNMPPLVDLKSPIFLSNTIPAFLYQHVGEQVKILQILGISSSLSMNDSATTDIMNNRDQNEMSDTTLQVSLEATSNDEVFKSEDAVLPADAHDNFSNKNKNDIISNDKATSYFSQTSNKDMKSCEIFAQSVLEPTVQSNVSSLLNKKIDTKPTDKATREIIAQSVLEPTVQSNVISILNEKNYTKPTDKATREIIAQSVLELTVQSNDSSQLNKKIDTKPTEELEGISSDCKSDDENSFEDGDDEASFGTPEPSPKTGRKHIKGKYGKSKAPLPPKIDETEITEFIQCVSVSEEAQNVKSIDDAIDNNSSTDKNKLEVVDSKDREKRSKSKSPNRMLKGNSSTLEKIFQLPGKFAFWQKTEDKSKHDTIAIERPLEEFQSCLDISTLVTDVSADTHLVNDENVSIDVEVSNENISENIIEKSDALQKLIDATLQTHPEYKFVPLHEEIPTTSKSTDV